MDMLNYCQDDSYANRNNEAILLSHLGVLEFAEGRNEEEAKNFYKMLLVAIERQSQRNLLLIMKKILPVLFTLI